MINLEQAREVARVARAVRSGVDAFLSAQREAFAEGRSFFEMDPDASMATLDAVRLAERDVRNLELAAGIP